MISKRESIGEPKELNSLLRKVTIKELATILRRDESTVYRWIRKGLTPLQTLAIRSIDKHRGKVNRLTRPKV